MSIKEINGIKYVDVDLSANIQKLLDNAADAKEERKIALEYILEKLRGEYRTSDGRLVVISVLGAKKITSGAAPLIKLRTAPHLAELIESGRFSDLIDAEPKKHDRFKQFAFYDVIFKIGDNWYGGVLNIGILKNNESRLYDLNPFEKIEKAESPNWVSKRPAKNHSTWGNGSASPEISESATAPKTAHGLTPTT